MHITAITVSGGTLTLPTALPFNLGNLSEDATLTLDANFTSAAAKPDTDYTLTVDGTYREHGHTFKFSLQPTVRTPPASPGSATGGTATAPSNTVNGAHFPPQQPNFGGDVNEPGHGRPIPTGPVRPIPPSSPSTVKPAPKGSGGGGGSASISFPTNDPLGINSSGTAEPTGASDPSGQIVFEAANWYAAYSTNGGSSFTQLNPTTIFPNNVDGGFCCDQIVQYAPSIDRFIWVLQLRCHQSRAEPQPEENPHHRPKPLPHRLRQPRDGQKLRRNVVVVLRHHLDRRAGRDQYLVARLPGYLGRLLELLPQLRRRQQQRPRHRSHPAVQHQGRRAPSTSALPTAPTPPQPTAATSARTPATRSSGPATTPTAPSASSTGRTQPTPTPGATSTSAAGRRSPAPT